MEGAGLGGGLQKDEDAKKRLAGQVIEVKIDYYLANTLSRDWRPDPLEIHPYRYFAGKYIEYIRENPYKSIISPSRL